MNNEEQKVVLLVDDTPANIQMVQAILKDSYRIRVATNGIKALALANSEPTPDLILLDVMHARHGRIRSLYPLEICPCDQGNPGNLSHRTN